MKAWLAISSISIFSIVQLCAQEPANYTVRYKPLVILDQPNGKVLARVPKNASVLISDYNLQCDCFKAKYLDFEGILLSKLWLEDLFSKTVKKGKSSYSMNDNITRLLTEYRLANDKDDEAAFTVEKENASPDGNLTRILDLINKWGYTDGKRIADGKIWLGMSIDMTLESWGIPYRVNRDHGDWGMREQWIYSEAYLYFENGILCEIFRLNSQ